MRLITSILAIVIFGTAFGCTKDKKSSDNKNAVGSDGDTDAGTIDGVADTGDDELSEEEKLPNIGTIALGDNPLAIAYPEGLAVAMVPDVVPETIPTSLPQVAGTIAITAELALQSPVAVDAPATMVEKVVATSEILTAESDCFNPSLLNPLPGGPLSSCYNPDTDLNFDPTNPTASDPRPTDQASGEACMAAYARARTAGVVAMVDRGTGFLAAMLCEAKKAGLADAFPAVGAKLNLKTHLTTALGGVTGVEVEVASIERLTDAADGLRLYSEVTFTHTRQDGRVRRETIKLLHSPSLTEANLTHHGRLWIASGESSAGDPNPEAIFLRANYQRSGTASAPIISIEMLEGAYTRAAAPAAINEAKIGDPFDANGNFNMSFGANFAVNANDNLYGHWPDDGSGDLNKTMRRSQYVAMKLNPLTSVGRVMSWQNMGGNYKEAARGMVFDLEEHTGNQLKGCSISGAVRDWSIRKSQKEANFSKLKPTGYYHPMSSVENIEPTCGDGLCQFAAYVYRQCFAQDANGKYKLDEGEMDGSAGFEILPAADAKVTAVGLPDVSGIPDVTR